MTAEQERDIRTVAGFIRGWWPGLEDGLNWPQDADEPEKNPVYAAATRLMQSIPLKGPS